MANPEPATGRRILETHLGLIHRIIDAICAHYRIDGPDIEPVRAYALDCLQHDNGRVLVEAGTNPVSETYLELVLTAICRRWIVPDQVLTEHLPKIRSIVHQLCAKIGMNPSDEADVLGVAQLALIENDYRKIRSCRDATLTHTFLEKILRNELIDTERKHNPAKKRFRPSTAAQQLGPVAEALEKYCWQGLHLEEAIAKITRELTAANQPVPSPAEFAAMVAPLRLRTPVSVLATDPQTMVFASAAADAESVLLHDELVTLLRTWKMGLNDEDRLLLQWYFLDVLTVAEIARIIGISDYRVRQRLAVMDDLARTIKQAGYSMDDMRPILDAFEAAFSPAAEAVTAGSENSLSVTAKLSSAVTS
jgi:RNA polymerase sigma factor (sigma-70 family)